MRNIIFVISLMFIIILCFFTNRKMVEGFRPFSYLGEDIRQGNPYSTSDRPNIYIPKDKKFCNSPRYTYFGTPNPLLHQMKPMTAPRDSMFYFRDYKCAPECCPSPYSCSGGCVCIGAKNLYKCKYNPPIENEILGPNSF